GRLVEREQALARAQNRDAPTAAPSELTEAFEKSWNLAPVPDRIAADERRPADHRVGEERAAARREEVALVAAQREVRERVAPVLLDQAPREGAISDGRMLAPAPGAQPQVEPAECEERRSRGHQVDQVVGQKALVHLVEEERGEERAERRGRQNERLH